jgi:hypothetical protein
MADHEINDEAKKSSNYSNSSALLYGNCYCESIKFEVRSDVEQTTAVYCHCESCRRAHAAPLYQVVYVEEAAFRIIEGENLLKDFCKPSTHVDGPIIRSFCSNCGSRICNRMPQKPQLGVGFFPALLCEKDQHNLPEAFKAKYHYLSHEATINLENMVDGLPRK